jgi:hypothetical protein
MMHDAVSFDLSNLTWLAEDFGIFFDDGRIFAFRSKDNVRNCDLFGILFGETSETM